MPRRCCCKGPRQWCFCANCKSDIAVCCVSLTFSGITNNSCGECGVLNDIFWLHQIFDSYGEATCEWECDFIEWDCDAHTITLVIVEVDSDYIIRTTITGGADDIVWEKNCGTTRPNCLVSHELDYVSGGAECTATGTTVTYTPTGFYNDTCQCGDCTDCQEGRTPWGLIFDVEGLDEGFDGCNDNCYCLNGTWGLNATSVNRCRWDCNFGCKPGCGDNTGRPYAGMAKTGPDTWTLSFCIGDAVFQKTWGSEPDCTNWSRTELTWVDPYGSGDLICDGSEAKVYVTAAQITPGNKYGWTGEVNNPVNAGCGVCECDEDVEPQEAQPATLLLTWTPVNCTDVATSYVLSRYYKYPCSCFWRIILGTCFDSDGPSLRGIVKLKKITFSLDVDLVTPVYDICRYNIITEHDSPCPTITTKSVSSGQSRCPCNPIDADLGTLVIPIGEGSCTFTNIRVQEV